MIDGVLLNPTRSALLDVLTASGLQPVLSVEEQHGQLQAPSRWRRAGKPVEIAGAQTALVVSTSPSVLVVTAPFGAGFGSA